MPSAKQYWRCLLGSTPLFHLAPYQPDRPGWKAAHHSQVGGDGAQAYPALKPLLTMIEPASQLVLALEHTDASLHTSMVTPAAMEPTLAFVLAALLILVAWLGQDHPLDTHILGVGLVVG